MSLSYTTGNPNNLTGGANASMNDIQGPFVDIRTFLTDGSGAVGDTILASPNNGIWRQIASTTGFIPAGSAVGNYWIHSGGITGSTGSTANPTEQWSPSSADVAVTSKTTRLRSVVTYSINATGPGVTLTWGLYPITATAGALGVISYSFGAVLAGSTVAVASPSASTNARVASSSFDYSTASATTYLFGVALSGTTAANSYVHFSYRLEQRHT